MGENHKPLRGFSQRPEQQLFESCFTIRRYCHDSVGQGAEPSWRFQYASYLASLCGYIAVLRSDVTISSFNAMSTSTFSTLTQRAKAIWVVTTVAGIGMLILAAILANPTSFLENYYGRVQNKDPKSRYLGHGGLNNGHCWTNPGECGIDLSDFSRRRNIGVLTNHQGGQTCEDVKIHHETDTAFLGKFASFQTTQNISDSCITTACGDPVGRSQFYPPINNHWTSKRKDYREYFLKYDIKVSKGRLLELSVYQGWENAYHIVHSGK